MGVGVGGGGSGEGVWVAFSAGVVAEEDVAVGDDSGSEHAVMIKMVTRTRTTQLQRLWVCCLILFSFYVIGGATEAGKGNETFNVRFCWLSVSHVL